LIYGCDSGVDLDGLRVGDEVVLKAEDGAEYRVGLAAWTQAVCEFSDSIRAFYDAASPKQPGYPDEERSFGKFLAEWSRRRSAL
jgi:hypothetical protein